RAAALPRHDTLKSGPEQVLLEGDDQILAIEWHWYEGAQVLVIANGSFLLNEPLVHHGRRALATRVVDWAGALPRKVAFVEGLDVTAGSAAEEAPSPFALWFISPFNWVFGHL